MIAWDRSPDFPRGCPLVPHPVEFGVVSQGVHRFPETGVTEGVHLAVPCQTFQRTPFEDTGVIAARNIVEHFRLADEISGVDPVAVSVGLFLK